MRKYWTSEEIRVKLENSLPWLERGILAIYRNQTIEEQRYGETLLENNMGFSGADGKYLSYVAGYLKSGNHLSGHHLEKIRKKMLKYSKQLAKIANNEL